MSPAEPAAAPDAGRSGPRPGVARLGAVRGRRLDRQRSLVALASQGDRGAMTDLLRHDQTLAALRRRRTAPGPVGPARPTSLAVRPVDWQPGTVNTASQLLALLD